MSGIKVDMTVARSLPPDKDFVNKDGVYDLGAVNRAMDKAQSQARKGASEKDREIPIPSTHERR